MKKVLALVLALLMVLSLVACAAEKAPEETKTSNESNTPVEESKQPDANLSLAGLKIGVSTSYLEDDYCIAMNYGLVEDLKALGAEVVLQNSNSDGETQTKQIEAFIEDGVDFLFVNPPTADVCVPAIEKAADTGIGIISFDGGINTDKGVITGVTCNDLQDGYNMGLFIIDYVKENLDGKATILLESWMEIERIKNRCDGVKNALSECDLDLTIVELDSKGSREGAANVTANYAGEYDIIVASEMNTAFGAITTLEAQNNKNVKVFNVSGWGEEDFTAIKEGNEYYVNFITRTPLMIKELAVQALVDYVNGKESERYTYVTGAFVDATNVNEWWDFDNNTPLK